MLSADQSTKTASKVSLEKKDYFDEQKDETTFSSKQDINRSSEEKHSDTIGTLRDDSKENRELGNENIPHKKNILEFDGYSEEYVEYNSEKMVADILENLYYWLDNGTENSHQNILRIRNSVDFYSGYLKEKDENRIFLNLIKLLFNNNQWEQLSEGRLREFVNEVEKFSDGDISWDKLRLFSEQSERLKLSVTKKNEE